ncbi:unnamed protein product [Adineta ricciae]|uniref:Microtubule-associated protein Jupiter n=1 Tax=Adineta ricciae TaxID=249248 RepID=A0A814CB82_ADIRI|nr:unnamed protein product [Adineta ricciae]
MSNIPSNHPSIRVHAPPGGHSNNIFGTSEFEQSAANKKKHMESDIFGSKKETNEPTSATKPARNTGSNIFGTDSEQSNIKSGTIAGQFKQTQMKSNIFGSDEPTSSRPVSDKNKSDIFGVNDKNEQNKQSNVRQGLRDPNASRMGYNPINGEAYAPKENINTNEKEVEPSTKAAESEHAEVKDNAPTDNAQTPTEKPAEATNGNAAQKSVHTSVRVFHPPGGKSNGPLW